MLARGELVRSQLQRPRRADPPRKEIKRRSNRSAVESDMDRAVVGGRSPQHANAITTGLPHVETQHDGTVAFGSDEKLFSLAPERRFPVVHRLDRRFDSFARDDRHPLGLEAGERFFCMQRPLFEPDRIVRVRANIGVRNDAVTTVAPFRAVTVSEIEDPSARSLGLIVITNQRDAVPVEDLARRRHAEDFVPFHCFGPAHPARDRMMIGDRMFDLR